MVYDDAFFDTIKRYSLIPRDRLTVLPAISNDFFDEIMLGILILHASWSGTSISSIKAITTVLTYDEFSPIPLYIANIDHAEFDISFIRQYKILGHGEAFWVKSGMVIAYLHKPGSASLDELRQLCRQLLNAA